MRMPMQQEKLIQFFYFFLAPKTRIIPLDTFDENWPW